MFTPNRIAGGALAALALGVLVESRVLPLGSLRNPGPAYTPVVLALLLFGFGILLIIRRAPDLGAGTIGWSDWRHALAILGACAFAGLALERLGYRLTILIVTGFLLIAVERRGVLATSLFALALAFGSYFLFATVLRVPLPRGPLGL
ncbi:MAG: tripartite tricarboxylate transporter TctB family protein [Candidatus Rokuibacteriota bacterium]